MKPLQGIAVGLLIVIFSAVAAGIDLLADPVGWLIVVLAVRRLPATLPHRSLTLTCAAAALLVSIPLAVPAVRRALENGDEAIAWSANLPWLLFLVMLAAALIRSALEARDTGAAAWWRAAQLGAAALIVLPVLVFGGGLTGLEPTTAAAVGLVPLAIVVLLLVHASRPWATSSAAPQ